MDATITPAQQPPPDGIARAFAFEHSFADALEGLYVPWHGVDWAAPQIAVFNEGLAQELGLALDDIPREALAAMLSGKVLPATARPIAQGYAGHQFGGFSPQLGDGRALLLGELIDRQGRRRDLHLKGSGRTPFSRGGDGKAVLGPMLREYIVGEAMHALGVPTTRALAVVTTGEQVARDRLLPGAVLARVAASHLRVGSFQFLAARDDPERLRRLADYAIARHHPAAAQTDDPYFALFEAVARAQAALIARWMCVGFVHGVMNTDNMTISGETIDYGPCAFLDAYSARAVFSSIDQHGRYAYGNQPAIARWNLARLAEALLPLMAGGDSDAAVKRATELLQQWEDIYRGFWRAGMRAKLGVSELPSGGATTAVSDADDQKLIESLLSLMESQQIDFTQLFRALSSALRGDETSVKALFTDAAPVTAWLAQWRARLAQDGGTGELPARADAMDRVNPIYIPRNHLVEAALEAAEQREDLQPFHTLMQALAAPFTERPGPESHARPAPAGCGPYVTYCGT